MSIYCISNVLCSILIHNTVYCNVGHQQSLVTDVLVCTLLILIFTPWGPPFVVAHWSVERKVIKTLIMFS